MEIGASLKDAHAKVELPIAMTNREIQKPAKGSGYIPTLDGWRAVAILWVMQHHAPSISIGGISNYWFKVDGDRGVQLFFALSGILICTRLLREEEKLGAISLRSFYTRRLFRIQPAAWTYLAVISVLMLIGSIDRDWKGLAGSLLMIRNFFPAKGGFWETTHFWSLAAEEHFYILLPGFLVFCRRYRLVLMSALVVVFELWRIEVFSHPKLQGLTMLITLRTDMVIGGILLGCAFALALIQPKVQTFAKAYLSPWLAWLYAALIFLSLDLHGSRANHALLISVYPVLITSTMLHPESLTSRVLEWPPLRFVGRISFSLYLWQQLFFDPFVAPTPGSFRSHTLLCWCAAFACAIICYYLIETPLIRRGHRIAKRFDNEIASPVPAAAN
jgi:peptidoglycan/LPS O-acetylase OafA/YrhL